MIIKSLAILLVSLSISGAFDWYSLTEQNYNAVQSGLGELNDAASSMNKSLIQYQGYCQDAFKGLISYMNRSLDALQRTFPEVAGISTDKLPSTLEYIEYIEMIFDQFRRTATNNVMMPAQGIIQNILDALNDMFFSSNQECATRYAANIVQPRISVGRLSDCLNTNVYFFKGFNDVIQLLLRYTQSAVVSTLAQVSHCSRDSEARSCVTKFFSDLPKTLASLVENIEGMQLVPDSLAPPTHERIQECVQLVTIDIQEAIQNVKDNITACSGQ